VSDERDIVEMTKNGSVHELATAVQAERARIRELEERLHERDLAVAALSQQLDDRDAAWERAIQSLAEQGVIMINDPIAAIRERLEAEGGGA